MLNLTRLDVRYTMAIRTSVAAVQTAIAGIDDDAWQSIEYTNDGVAEVAECDYTSGQGTKRTTRRMIVRRTRFTDTTQQKLWPDWRHHAFLTDLDGDVVDVDRFHREHATVELAIKDSEGRRRTRAPPVGGVLGELGVVPDRDPGAQHAALDHPPRRSRHRPPDRCAHHPHPTPRAARPTRQPRRTIHSAVCRRVGPGPTRSPRSSTHSERSNPSPPDIGPAVRCAAEPTQRHQPNLAKTVFVTPLRRSDSIDAASTTPATLTNRSPSPSRWIEAETPPSPSQFPRLSLSSDCKYRVLGLGRYAGDSAVLGLGRDAAR